MPVFSEQAALACAVKEVLGCRGRSREAGKKLTWRDGADALWILYRERLAAPCA
jgi:hypothetical protein